MKQSRTQGVLLSAHTLEPQRSFPAVKISGAVFQWPLFYLSLLLIDALMVWLAFRSAYFIRFEAQIPFFILDVVPSANYYSSLVYVLIPGWLILFAAIGLYLRKNLLGGTREYALIFNAATAGMLLIIIAGFLGVDFVIARGWLVLSWILVFTYTSAGRFVMRRIFYYLRGKGYLLAHALIIGANEEGQSLAAQLKEWKYSGMVILGFIAQQQNHVEQVSDEHFAVLGRLEDLDTVIKEYGVKELIIAVSAISRESMIEIFNKYGVASDINLRMSSGLYEIITTGLDIREIANVPLVNVNKVRLTGVDQWMKFILDYGLAFPGIVLISPILMLIALAVKLDSPGPIFYRRRVMGLNARTFDAFKFRTMYVNGDEILDRHPEQKEELLRTHKLKNDPRITRVGKFLRKLSLDELPQVWNVLRHEMSLVGPRMISPPELADYNQWGMNLLTIRPGITGLWQVSGRSDISYEQRVRLDMYYIRNWSVLMDIQILIQTIPVVLKSKGAY
jgi:exopolysaccharide biosynthesis polyprenyl glycosylphosphotransferase